MNIISQDLNWRNGRNSKLFSSEILKRIVTETHSQREKIAPGGVEPQKNVNVEQILEL